ncbi:MAG: chorismate synthase, partial [Clostridia bacterium]|nr:chorismate synthase [Clostridia bacterium]
EVMHAALLLGYGASAICPYMTFAVLDDARGDEMREAILAARNDLDSVGGVLETAVTGLPAGLGDPWFDTVEGILAHAVFSIPGVKGVEFGAGFGIAGMRGSEANDAFSIRGGKIVTDTNNSGGINGGITNGAPLIIRCAVRPTPSIAKEQKTVDYINSKEVAVSVPGRHDPCIVHRARAVVDCVTALAVYDLLAGGNAV